MDKIDDLVFGMLMLNFVWSYGCYVNVGVNIGKFDRDFWWIGCWSWNSKKCKKCLVIYWVNLE